TQRAIKPLDMLLQLERPAVEGTSHIEGGIAVFEAAVAERQHDLALRHDTAVEIRNPVVGPSLTHQRPPSNSGARVSAKSSTAATSVPASVSSSAIDSAIMPRLANQMPRSTRSK